MDFYKDIAKKKHLEYLKTTQKNKIEQEKEDIEIKKIQEEIVKKENLSLSIILEITENIDVIQTNYSYETLICCLSHIESIIMTNIDLIKESKFKETQGLILNLVNVINLLNENDKNKDLNIVKLISNFMENIFTFLELDIDIELMDTSDDEKYACEINELQKANLIKEDIELAKKLSNKK